MKTLQIKKIETDTEFSSIEFVGGVETDGSDFDLEQLGTDIVFISSGFGCVMVSGTVTLKAGDSITDDFGGEPVIGTVRREAIHKNMSIVKESDYRDSFAQKSTGQGEH